MKVTDKNFFLAECLIDKMDLIIQRVTKRKLDAVLLVDGDEGFGKTGLSLQLAYYLSYKTGRKFDLDNVFFCPNEFMNYVNSTKEQIIIWDEAALGGLASGWQNKSQQSIIQTLMTCRFRKHIIIFNCPKFYRLNQYFVLERAMGLCHVYSHDGLHAGRFTYHKKDMLEKMIDIWYKKRQKPYKMFTRTYLRGTFVDGFNLNIIDEDAYDKKKEKYTQKLINQATGKTKNKDKEELDKLKTYIVQDKDKTIKQLAEQFNVSERTISRWRELAQKTPITTTV